jgi:hypothetical protein
MRKRCTIVFGLALLLALTGDCAARSHHPKPKPQAKTSQLSEQQRPAQPSPAINPLTPEQITKAITDGIQAAAKQYEANHPTTPPDDSGWWFNFLLVVFTGGLVVVGAAQGYLIFGTLRLAREEFISTHRPRIVLRDVHLEERQVFYMLANTGDTDATIVESWILGEFVPNGTPIRPLRSFDHNDLGRIVFAAGQVRELTYDLPPDLGFAIMFPNSRRIGLEGQPPVQGERYFTGTIVYEDDRGVRRRSIFRRIWDDSSHSFVRLFPNQEQDHEYSD